MYLRASPSKVSRLLCGLSAVVALSAVGVLSARFANASGDCLGDLERRLAELRAHAAYTAALKLDSQSSSAASDEFAHLLPHPDGGVEVLLPMPEGGFEVAVAPDASAGRRWLRDRLKATASEPLQLGPMVAEKRQVLDEVRGLLLEIVKVEPGTLKAERLKEVGSLREKIFRKVRAQGRTFRLSELDDVAGARMIVHDPSRLDAVAGRLTKAPGFTVHRDELKAKAGGYRARHVTLRTPQGHLVEIQVMTERMGVWSDWNHKRVYKPQGVRVDSPASIQYFERLQKYDRELVTYLRALDDGQSDPAGAAIEVPAVPDGKTLGIREEDLFPEEWLTRGAPSSGRLPASVLNE